MPVKPEGGSYGVSQHCQMWRRGLIESRGVSGAQAVKEQGSRRIADAMELRERNGDGLMLMRCHGFCKQ